MRSGGISRRSAMVGAAAVGGVAGFAGGPAHALVSVVGNAPASDLSREIEALRQATALVKRLGKERTTFWDDYPPEYPKACDHAGTLMEGVFLSRARCKGDVIAKYGLFEEYGIRHMWIRDGRDSRGYYGRYVSKSHRRYFDIMDADIARYGVDVHPWWHDSEGARPRIHGQLVRWRDGAWQVADKEKGRNQSAFLVG